MTPPEGSHEAAPSWPLKTTQKQSSSRRAHTASEWGAVPPKRQAQGGIHVRPEARIAANSAPAIGTPTTAGPSVRQHAQRHRTRGAAGPRPLSPGPIATLSFGRRWTRSGLAAGPPQGTIPVHERAQRLYRERPQVDRSVEQLTVCPA